MKIVKKTDLLKNISGFLIEMGILTNFKGMNVFQICSCATAQLEGCGLFL